MRFSIILVLCAICAPILAVPVPGRKPGTNMKKVDPNVPKVDANPGDVVLVKSQHFLEGDVGAGSSKRRIHPAIVVSHDPDTHIVHVAPIGHAHPGGVLTIPADEVGIPAMDHRPSLVGLGKPKMIHQDNIKPLGQARAGNVEIPNTISAENFDTLTKKLPPHAPPPAPKPEKKEKKEKKKINKRDLERRSKGAPEM